MTRPNTSSGMGDLLGLAIIALVIGAVVYSVWGTSTPPEPAPEQPKVVQQPQGVSTDQIIQSLGIGDGTLGAASTLSASDLGKATPISGGGISGGSSGGGTSSRRSSSSPSAPAPRSGG